MGNQEPQTILQRDWSIRQNYKLDIPGQPQTVINVNGLMAQLYELEFERGHDVQRELFKYSSRKQSKSGHLVHVLAAFPQSNQILDCGGGKIYLRVLTQNIPLRLHKSQNLTRKQGLILLEGALKGFQEICTQKNTYFQLNQSLIGWSDANIPKVWLNSNFSVNQISPFSKTTSEEQMIWELINLISKKTIGRRLVPINIKISNFSQAISVTRKQINQLECRPFYQRNHNLSQLAAPSHLNFRSEAKSNSLYSYSRFFQQNTPVYSFKEDRFPRSSRSNSVFTSNRSQAQTIRTLTPPKTIPIPEQKQVPTFLRNRPNIITKTNKIIMPISPVYPLRQRLYTEQFIQSNSSLPPEKNLKIERKSGLKGGHILVKNISSVTSLQKLHTQTKNDTLISSGSGVISPQLIPNNRVPYSRSYELKKTRNKSPVTFSYSNKPLEQPYLTNHKNKNKLPIKINPQNSYSTKFICHQDLAQKIQTQNCFTDLNSQLFFGFQQNKLEPLRSWENIQSSSSFQPKQAMTQATLQNKITYSLPKKQKIINSKRSNEEIDKQQLEKYKKKSQYSHDILPSQAKSKDKKDMIQFQSESTIRNSLNLDFRSQQSFSQKQAASSIHNKVLKQKIVSKITQIIINPTESLEKLEESSKLKPQKKITKDENSVPSFLKKKSTRKQDEPQDIATQYKKRPLTKVEEQYHRMFLEENQNRNPEQEINYQNRSEQPKQKEEAHEYYEVNEEFVKTAEKNCEDLKNFRKTGTFKIPQTPFFEFESRKNSKKLQFENNDQNINELLFKDSYEQSEQGKDYKEEITQKQPKQYKNYHKDQFYSFQQAERLLQNKESQYKAKNKSISQNLTSFGKRKQWDEEDNDGFEDLGRKLQEMSVKFNQKLEVYDSNFYQDKFTKQYQDDDELGYALENGL